MTDLNQLSPLQRAAMALQKMQARIDALEQRDQQGIALIGMACRFPGAEDLDAFWQLLKNGVDAISEVPPERWAVDDYYDPDPQTAGKISTRNGGFIADIDKFDPGFFGMSSREAIDLDPQQRLLLEVSYQALEHAGQPVRELKNRPVGVFLGMTLTDYGFMQFFDDKDITAYTGTGTGLSFAAGRLAHTMGLQGPAMTLDTVCSSSLVAMHLASQSLRLGECELALVGGAQLTLSPASLLFLSRARALAPDGRCKTFDASANGYARGEGVGVVVAKTLEKAKADGDNIIAVVRGSAVNHDGPSSGFTVPNEQAQEKLIRQALANAGVEPSEVSYVEAHGTGTALGDPIEISALSSTYGEQRHKDQALNVGSVKTNIGHLEPAAGVAGLIKVCLSMQHDTLFPHLHFKQPNPHIPWSELAVKVPTSVQPWPQAHKMAGLSSFGMSGTNVHMIIEQGPEIDVRADIAPDAELLVLSAKDETALQARVKQIHGLLQSDEHPALEDICYSASVGRSHFEHRAAFVFEDKAQLIEQLEGFKPGSTEDTKTAFVFTGQGSQYPQMALSLYERVAIFREALEDCAKALAEHDLDLMALLADHSDILEQTRYTQPVLFAVEYALAKLWLALGVEPDVMMGHSVGEYAAACIAGVFSLADATKLIVNRGRLMTELCQPGAMLAVQASVDELEIEPGISVAAVNASDRVVLSGPSDSIERFAETLSVKHQLLSVSHAFHSHMMQPMLAEFRQVADSVKYTKPERSLCSTMTGQIERDAFATADYWVKHVEATVQFEQGVHTLESLGMGRMIEIGPQPILLGLVRRSVEDAELLSSLDGRRSDMRCLLGSIASLYQAGQDIDWTALYQGLGLRKCPLPQYPFKRESYWAKNAVVKQLTTKAPAAVYGERREVANLADNQSLHEWRLSVSHSDHLNDHKAFATVVLPAAAMMDMALVKDRPIANITFHQALLPDDKTVQLLTTGETFEIYSQDDEGRWQLYADGSLGKAQEAPASELQTWLDQCNQTVDVETYYERAKARRKLDYGSRFRGIKKLFTDSDNTRAVAQLTLPEGVAPHRERHRIHPVMLDCALQLCGVFVPDDSATYVPVSVERLELFGECPDKMIVAATWFGDRADITLYNAKGKPVAALIGLRVGAVTRQTLLGEAQTDIGEWFYQLDWQPKAHFDIPASEFIKKVDALKVRFEDDNLDWYPAFLQDLDRYCIEVIGQSRSRLDDSNIIEPQHKLWRALQGHVARYCEVPESAIPSQTMARLFADYPQAHAELTLIRRCAESLGEVLEGKADPIQLLFPEGDLGAARALYQEAPAAVAVNQGLVNAVKQLIANRPDNRGLRILEVGAGTGGTTGHLLPLLPEQSEYVFTDLSSLFLTKAEAQFSEYDNVKYQLLDIEQVPKSQGFDLASFDLVVAANVIHATRDLGTSLKHISQLLRPGGALVLLEGTEQQAWLDLTFGLTEGWWHFTDLDLRPDYPLLSGEQWQQTLHQAGFADSQCFVENYSKQSVIVAQTKRSERTAKRLVFGDLPVDGMRVLPGEAFAETAGAYQVNPTSKADFVQLLEAVGSVDQIVYGLALDGQIDDLERAAELANAGLLHLVQALLASGHTAKLGLVTHGAFTNNPAQALLWGKARTLFMEHNELAGWVMDVEHLEQITEQLDDIGPEQQVRFIDGKRCVARLERLALEDKPVTIHSDKGYLITGGLGALGMAVAESFSQQGAGHIYLVARREPSPAEQQRIDAMASKVTVLKADVTDFAQMQQAFEQIEMPLAGVVQSAGHLADGLIDKQEWSRFYSILPAKVQASYYLHQLTEGMALDFFVLFSSAIGLFGSTGQSNHAAANSFLDAFAEYRRGLGLPATSINWGVWADVGSGQHAQQRLSFKGIGSIDVDSGIDAFARILAGSPAQVAVTPMDWQVLTTQYRGWQFIERFEQADGTSAEAAQALAAELAECPDGAQKYRLVLDKVSAVVARALGEAEVDIKQGFVDLGMDSLVAVELKNQLQNLIGQPLPAALLFSYANVEQLTDYLVREVLMIDIHQQAVEVIEKPISTSSEIAIVGMACRFPGADDIDTFWQNLVDEVDVVSQVPSERWSVDALYSEDADAPGKTYARYGYFVDDIDQFDARFFGIAPVEARAMDPQQRLLLTTAWQALEHANIAPDSLADKPVGVFVGVSQMDYAMLQAGDYESLDGYSGTGNGLSFVAGRLAYTLGLQGPALALDTACSSSLVALHLACQSLREGECDVALAGGVHLAISPESHLFLSKVKALAMDGRCKAFAADADGFGRGEGSGVVVLKRAEPGQKHLAKILGSAVNHDGYSSGLTVPNQQAQQKVIRQALANAGVSPAQVNYIETHGTGTALGDPLEVAALNQVYGAERNDTLYLGSVKSNVGHLEAAAGMAGLVKTVMAMQHKQLPVSLHCQTTNPNIPWQKMPLAVAQQAQAWQQGLAGISSFGMSGTNAHVIVAPADAHESVETEAELQLFTLSAKSEHAFERLAGQYQPLAGNAADIAANLNTGRSHFDYRGFAVGSELPDWQSLAPVKAPLSAKPLIWCFTGQGSQYAGMGEALYQSDTVFRDCIDRCEAVHPGLKDLLFSNDEALLESTDNTQPAIYAIEVALAHRLLAWGIKPDGVMGHSIGEYAAACVAGVFSIEEGMQLVAARGRLMVELCEPGAMLSAAMSEADAKQFDGHISAVNGPEQVVFAGTEAEIDALQQGLDVVNKRLKVSHAFHSPMMAPMLDAFKTEALKVQYQTPSIRFVGSKQPNADYWTAHISEPVRFADGLASLGDVNVIEVGPKPTLTALIRMAGFEKACGVEANRHGLLNVLGNLYQLGYDIDFAALHGDFNRLTLPGYPLDPKSWWIKPSARTGRSAISGSGYGASVLGQPVEHLGLAEGSRLFENEVSIQHFPWLAEHKVFNRPVLPGAWHLAMALEAKGSGLKEVVFEKALLLDCAQRLQLLVENERVEVVSRQQDWQRHFSATLSDTKPQNQDLAALKAGFTEEVDVERYYLEARMARQIDYGPAFMGIKQLYCNDNQALARVESKHLPALLDACIQSMGPLLDVDPSHTYVPVALKQLHMGKMPGDKVWVHTTVDGLSADFTVFDGQGDVLLQMMGLQVQQVTSLESAEDWSDWLYQSRWQAKPLFALPLNTDLALPEPNVAALADYPPMLARLNPLIAQVSAYWLDKVGDKVISAQAQLVERLQEMIADDGAEGHDGVFADLEQLETDFPALAQELKLVNHCANNLGDVLTGKVEATDVLFPEGDFSLASGLYSDSPGAQVMNNLAADVLKAVFAARAKGKGVRIVEIGAGTGGTTGFLLPHIPEGACEYVFTDLSTLFLNRAKARYQQYPFVKYQLLDIEKSPMEQGLEAGSVDIVIAANVLHATENLPQTLRHIEQLLTPGGMLMLLEGTAKSRYLDLTFGLTEGWWRFDDGVSR